MRQPLKRCRAPPGNATARPGAVPEGGGHVHGHLFSSCPHVARGLTSHSAGCPPRPVPAHHPPCAPFPMPTSNAQVHANGEAVREEAPAKDAGRPMRAIQQLHRRAPVALQADLRGVEVLSCCLRMDDDGKQAPSCSSNRFPPGTHPPALLFRQQVDGALLLERRDLVAHAHLQGVCA